MNAMNNTFDSVIKGKTLDVTLAKAGAGFESLNALCTDLFLIVMNITPDVDMGTEDEIRRILKYYVDQFVQNCNAVNVDSKKRDYIKYALVALIDEKILKLPEKWSDSWRIHMLQLDYFGDMVAGERFYEHLDFLMKNPTVYYDVLEIYYLCLCLGFKGMYMYRQEELQALIRKLPGMIFSSRPASVKPVTVHRQKESRSRQIVPHVPTWAIASIAAVIVLVTWLGVVIATGNLSRKMLPDGEMTEKTE